MRKAHDSAQLNTALPVVRCCHRASRVADALRVCAVACSLLDRADRAPAAGRGRELHADAVVGAALREAMQGADASAFNERLARATQGPRKVPAHRSCSRHRPISLNTECMAAALPSLASASQRNTVTHHHGALSDAAFSCRAAPMAHCGLLGA